MERIPRLVPVRAVQPMSLNQKRLQLDSISVILQRITFKRQNQNLPLQQRQIDCAKLQQKTNPISIDFGPVNSGEKDGMEVFEMSPLSRTAMQYTYSSPSF